MNGEFLSIITQIEREKGIDKEVLFEGIEQALLIAVKKIARISNPGAQVRVEINRQTGEVKAFMDDKEITTEEFGRIAAQTARQVIIQKIREAEKETVFNEFHKKVGEIVSGSVYKVDEKAVIVDFLGRARGYLPKKFLSPLDVFKIGERIRCLVLEVTKESKGAKILLTRTHVNFVKKLFELEIPEIYEGIVEIKSISREPGERTKIAVYSKDEKIDSVGACVGMKGTRVKNIVQELKGEKIDIIRYSDDIKEFIANALQPASITKIVIDRSTLTATVIVPEESLSLAIGKHGQNVRLASKLVGWNIDIRTKKMLKLPGEELEEFKKIKGLGKNTLQALLNAGITSLVELASKSVEELVKIKGIGKKKAIFLKEKAQKILDEEKR